MVLFLPGYEKVYRFLTITLCTYSCNCGGVRASSESVHMTKKENEVFFDESFCVKGADYNPPEKISRMDGWVKVGQTYTFRKINYLDLLASPRMWTESSLMITFNGDRTVNIKHSGAGKTVKVDYFSLSWSTRAPFETDSGYYGIRMFLEDDTELWMFKQLKPGEFGNNLYGMRIDSENYVFCTGTQTTDVNFANPFDY